MDNESNVIGTTENDLREDWRVFDRLPPAIRRALHEGVVSWTAHEAAQDLQKAKRRGLSLSEAIAFVVKIYQDADADEVEDFDPDSPHNRSGASIQRYGSAQSVPNPSSRLVPQTAPDCPKRPTGQDDNPAQPIEIQGSDGGRDRD